MRCAIAVGTTAESAIAQMSTENWAFVITPRVRPAWLAIVPNVRPVDISRATGHACVGAYLRASGNTAPDLEASFAASSKTSRPRLATTRGSDTFMPACRKKNGVRRANDTTRARACSSRCRAKTGAIA